MRRPLGPGAGDHRTTAQDVEIAALAQRGSGGLALTEAPRCARRILSIVQRFDRARDGRMVGERRIDARAEHDRLASRRRCIQDGKDGKDGDVGTT
jgi:hypothetical protein